MVVRPSEQIVVGRPSEQVVVGRPSGCGKGRGRSTERTEHDRSSAVLDRSWTTTSAGVHLRRGPLSARVRERN